MTTALKRIGEVMCPSYLREERIIVCVCVCVFVCVCFNSTIDQQWRSICLLMSALRMTLHMCLWAMNCRVVVLTFRIFGIFGTVRLVGMIVLISDILCLVYQEVVRITANNSICVSLHMFVSNLVFGLRHIVVAHSQWMNNWLTDRMTDWQTERMLLFSACFGWEPSWGLKPV